MKLYDCQTAPSPRRVRVFAAEKNIELDKVEIDLSKGDQFSDAYREVNPDCVVPVLELDDGTRITEVLAICDYLEELQPEPSLFGRSALERAAVLEWNSKVEQQGLLAMMDTFRNAAKGLKGHALPGPQSYEQIPELAERGRQRVLAFFDKLDGRLADNDFVAGEFYSIADISAMIFVDFAAWVKIGIPEHAANVQRWHAAVAARPSARA
jgi:glutathione S-transferase